MPSRILIIDDDTTILQALKAKLAAVPDLEVRTTTESVGVPALVKAFNPHLVVCDVDMEPLNGGEVAVELRADPETSACKVVFLTSLVDPLQIARGQGVVGGRRMISKQSSLSAIIERIRSEIPG